MYWLDLGVLGFALKRNRVTKLRKERSEASAHRNSVSSFSASTGAEHSNPCFVALLKGEVVETSIALYW
jgi:hypothetical protein